MSNEHFAQSKSDSKLNLETHHIEDLRRSGLSDKTIIEAGIFSATADRVNEILGFNPENSTGMAFPYYFDANDSNHPYIRIKIDNPPLIGGKPAKYLSPKRSQNHLYIPPQLISVLNEPSKPLYITEGEKKALKAAQEGLDCIALAGVWCWKGKDVDGESKPIPDLNKIKWNERNVFIIFDSDASHKPSVLKAEKALASELNSRGAHVRAIRLPENGDSKVGLDDFLMNGSLKKLLQLPQIDPLQKNKKTVNKKEEKQSVRLIKLASELPLFHDDNDEAFAFFNGEAIPLRSKKIKHWLTRQFYESENNTPNSDALNQAIMALEAKAIYDGPRIMLHNRIAKSENAFWFDMGNGKAIKTTAEEWAIVDAPILFRRYPHQQPQVTPANPGDPKKIFDFINITEESKLLVLVCIISYFVPDIPHPIFHPHGPHGAGKTSLFKILKIICDPSSIEAIITPRDINQLVQIINHHHVCLFDNLSKIPDRMSDILSQACTGGGFSKRQLYTDDDDIIYKVKRCIGLNGINLLIKKPDLMDRSILIYQDRIDPSNRVEEAKIWEEFQMSIPEILGGIFDALSRAMSIFPTIKLHSLPRMADFARWGCAIAEALGYTSQDFLESYMNNIEKQNDEIIQSNTLAQAVLSLMSSENEWTGTIKVAWKKLSDIADPNKADKTFPGSERSLRKHLDRIKANLLDHGITYEIGPRGEKGYPISFQKRTDLSSSNTGCAANQKDSGIDPEHVMNQDKGIESSSEGYSGRDQIETAESEHPELNEHNYPKSWDDI